MELNTKQTSRAAPVFALIGLIGLVQCPLSIKWHYLHFKSDLYEKFNYSSRFCSSSVKQSNERLYVKFEMMISVKGIRPKQFPISLPLFSNGMAGQTKGYHGPTLARECYIGHLCFLHLIFRHKKMFSFTEES